MDNKRIAEILDEIGDMLSLEDYPTARFEVRAYKKAALMVSTMQEPIEEIYRKGGRKALMEIPGIGETMSKHIEELVKTGKLKKYEELKKKYPIDMASLTTINGMGVKKAVLLYKRLGIKNVDDLKKAAEAHKISKLKGFGEKSEEVIRQGIAFQQSTRKRVLIQEGLPVAEELLEKIEESGLAEKALVAGSARRMRETIGDIDILVISKNPKGVIDFFANLKEVETVMAKGPTRAAVRLKMGLNCDLRAIPPKSFGAAVQYFSGSRDHNIEVRRIAMDKGYKLNEYGLFDKKGRNVGGPNEVSLYEKLGMEWLPPEMREARGEVKLAQAHKIPALVELKDIKGDLHTHSNELPGTTLEKMAETAIKLGWNYINNSDHTKSLVIEKGLDDKGFEKVFKNVDRLNNKLEKEGKKFRVLKGAECDILKDGSLDLKKGTLKKMDCVLGSVHSNTKMPEKEMTERIIKALDTGLVHVLAHPTGRIVNVRPPYAVDLQKVAEVCERNKIAMEINSSARLDLNDTNILLVSKYKVMFSIDTDSHRTQELSLMRYGVGTARRGWVTPNRVINTLNLRDLLKWLRR